LKINAFICIDRELKHFYRSSSHRTAILLSIPYVTGVKRNFSNLYEISDLLFFFSYFASQS